MRRRKRWLGVVLALVVVSAVAWVVRARSRSATAGAGRAGMAQGQGRPVPVTLATVSRRDVPVYLDGLGNVIAFRTVTIKTQVDGLLESVLFKEGQAVRKGQVLAQIDPRPFRNQLHQGEGALARDQAQLVGARLDLERYRTLAAQKLIPQQQADDQAALVGQLEGAVQIDRATIESARLNLVYARITSPIDGVTGIRIVDPGNVVHATDANGIVVVTQLDPIAVLFTLPQDQLTPVLDQLSHGPLTADVVAQNGSTLLGRGQVTFVDNQINQSTSTLRLKAVVPNPRRVLWPNQFVNVRLLLTTLRNALVMPVTAVQRGPTGTFVYVVGPDQTASPRPVEIENHEGDLAVVARGLQEGERVVTDGQNQLRPGSRVAPREQAPPTGSKEVAGDGTGAAPGGAANGRPRGGR